MVDTDWRQSLATDIAARGWGTAAVFVLELCKPLGLLGGHALMLLQPLAGASRRGGLDRWTRLLQDPDEIESLIVCIENSDRSSSAVVGGKP